MFKDAADGGGIGAMVNISQSNILVFDKAGTQYAWFNASTGNVKGVFGIKDLNTPLGEVPLDAVGAAIQFNPQSLYFFSADGSTAAVLRYAEANWSGNIGAPVTPIGDFDNGIYSTIDIYGDNDVYPFTGGDFTAAFALGLGKDKTGLFWK